MDTPKPLAPPAAASDARTIALVGLAHGTSHFFHMMLPPLFPLFVRDFGVSYAQLGLVVTLFFVISGIGQALAGFLVDRVGARPVLFAALACFVAAGVAGSMAQDLDGLLLAAALAGLGNSPFHPVDFTILNQRVASARLGHAFSIHGISGNLGWAVAPLFHHVVIEMTGSWRYSLLACAAWAALMLVLLLWQRDAVDDRAAGRAGAFPATPRTLSATGEPEGAFAFLRLPSVWLCFLFFFFSTCTLTAIQSFAGPSLARRYDLSLDVTAYVVSGYMLCGVVGMLIGGFVAPRARRLERTIGICLTGAALLLLLVGSGWLPAGAALAVTALAGMGPGLAGPSRDLLIKRASPPGATGRVYGTVYSGLDIGFALSSPIFGAILDHGAPGGVFYGAALALLLGVGSASLVGLRIAHNARAAA